MGLKMKAFQFLTGNSASLFAHFRNYNSHAQFEALVQSRCKSRDFTVVEALRLFDTFSDMRPMPSVRSFNQLIGSISKINEFSIVVSMYLHLVSFRGSDFEPDICALTVVTECLCRSNSAKSGFLVRSCPCSTALPCPYIIPQLF